jgi:hypothetical protein
MVLVLAALMTVAMALSAPTAFAKQSLAHCAKFSEKGAVAKQVKCEQKVCPPEATECPAADGDEK